MSVDGYVEDVHLSAGRLYPDLGDLQGSEFMNSLIEATGAVLMGRRTFAMGIRIPRRQLRVPGPDLRADPRAAACGAGPGREPDSAERLIGPDGVVLRSSGQHNQRLGDPPHFRLVDEIAVVLIDIDVDQESLHQEGEVRPGGVTVGEMGLVRADCRVRHETLQGARRVVGRDLQRWNQVGLGVIAEVQVGLTASISIGKPQGADGVEASRHITELERKREWEGDAEIYLRGGGQYLLARGRSPWGVSVCSAWSSTVRRRLRRRQLRNSSVTIFLT